MSDSKKNKSQRIDREKLITNWQYTEEVYPAFKRLIAILLKTRTSQSIEVLQAEKEYQSEQ